MLDLHMHAHFGLYMYTLINLCPMFISEPLDIAAIVGGVAAGIVIAVVVIVIVVCVVKSRTGKFLIGLQIRVRN